MWLAKFLNNIIKIAVLLNSSFLYSQFQFNYNDNINVKYLGVNLNMPWAGGLNFSQFSEIDFDFDGDMDLFIFDRSANQIRVFLQEELMGNKFYVFNPHASDKFPSELRYRSALIDYNGDGKNDLFTYGIGGIKVYKNIGDAVQGLQWQVAKELLYSDYWGAQLNLYVSSSDIPAIVDVDNDGDIDVLTYHIGGERLQYHKNISVELYGHSDSLVFELKNECWGKFREDFSTNTVYLNDTSSPCNSSNVPNPEFSEPYEIKFRENSTRHAGSTVLAMDIDGSGVKDLILGDVSYSNLTLLINGGIDANSNSAMISSDPSFPSNSTPVNLYLFPAAFNLDVDFDGVKDLIVSPNAKNISNNEKSIMFYKNTGSNNISNFVYNTNSFLQDGMIDHGSGSIPVFCDINGDGLQDMFVSNFFSYKDLAQKESKIAFYQNTGSNSVPEFTLIDDDFVNLSQFSLGLRIVPSFGDINGDNLPDLMIGLENGTIAYLQNTTVGSNISFSPIVFNYPDVNGTVISVGQYAAPQLFDLNQDGLIDLLIGDRVGGLTFYENTGTSSAASFQLINDNLGGVDVSSLQSSNGYAIPNFFNHNNDIFLMVGSHDGYLHFYDSLSGNLGIGQSFNNISNQFLGINVGAYSAPFINDIDADGKLNLFLGQDLGGVFHLEHDSLSNLSIQSVDKNEIISLYPNPCVDKINLKLFKPTLAPSYAHIFNYEGRLLKSALIKKGINEIDVKELQKGFYIIKSDVSLYHKRFIKN